MDLKLFLPTLLVILVIFFLAWVVTRFIAMKSSQGISGKFLTVLEKIPVTKDSYIMLVKISDKIMVVGVTAQGMTTLKELDADNIDIEALMPKQESFAEILKKSVDMTLPDGKIKDTFNRFLKKGGGGDEKNK